jgi:hypothetical protein
MSKSKIIPAYNPLEAPYIEVKAIIRQPGITNGIPNIKREVKYNVAPSAKKIATYIVNQIFGSELVTQTEGLEIGWLMPTLKEALEEGIYQGESFVYIHVFEDKIYLECIRKNEIHNLVQKFDKIVSCTIRQEYNEIFEDDELVYQLDRHIKLDNGITYMNLEAYSVNEKGERARISLALFNQRTGCEFIENYILPYEVLTNIDLGQLLFKDTEKLLNQEMVVYNTIADEIEKTKTRIVTSQHYQTGDIVSNWKPGNTQYEIKNLAVGQLQDYFTLLPGDKEHQIFEFLQGNIRIEEYISTFKFYDQQVIQMVGLSPASFGYEKDNYMNVDNVNLSKNNSEMTIEAIKNQIAKQIDNLIENIVKAQQSENIVINELPSELMWDYGENESFDDMKKIQVLSRVQKVMSIPYSTRAKILTPIVRKLIDEGVEEELINKMIEEHDKEEENINVVYGEV